MRGVYEAFPVMFDFHNLEFRLRERLKDYFDSSETTRIVQLGDPAEVIADYVRRHQVDLIMMPTHGYGRFRGMLLGSVVSKVLHDVDCPIWTAPHTADLGSLHHPPCRSILAAIDLDARQADVIRGAAELARELGVSLRLVHAVPGAEYLTGARIGLFLLSSARQDIANLQSQAGTTLEVSLMAGPVGKVVRKVALEYDSDLLVIGRGVMHETFGRLRTESHGIIRESPCPVLSL
jgi:nucleotide-binding universal stress UspA family protein